MIKCVKSVKLLNVKLFYQVNVCPYYLKFVKMIDWYLIVSSLSSQDIVINIHKYIYIDIHKIKSSRLCSQILFFLFSSFIFKENHILIEERNPFEKTVIVEEELDGT